MAQWKPEYSVGVTSLDAQHQRWFKILDQLQAAMRSGQADSIRDDVLRQMVTYTKTHFRLEEEYLEKHGYPDLPAHALLHRQFAQQLSALEAQFQTGRLELTITLLETLSGWLLNHVIKEDSRYAAYLSQS